jgi:hypothetical protein
VEPVKQIEVVECPYCGTRVYVPYYFQPLTQLERDATQYDPPSFLMIGDGHLLHRCELADD